MPDIVSTANILAASVPHVNAAASTTNADSLDGGGVHRISSQWRGSGSDRGAAANEYV